MATVTKQITKGASFYGKTTAVGELEHVKKHGFMACGSGDDHKLTKKDKSLVAVHNAKDGDLELPAGPLNV